MAHEKTLTNKNPMKMPWNKMKATTFFHGFLMIMKKPWIEKLFVIMSKFMGFSWGFLNSCPIKKPWVFRERLNINGSWKMKWLLMTFSLPMNYTPGFLFIGKTETWPPWKFSLKLFSTVKSNTSLTICWVVNLKLYTCSNNPNPEYIKADRFSSQCLTLITILRAYFKKNLQTAQSAVCILTPDSTLLWCTTV